MPKSIIRSYSCYSRNATALLGGLIRAARKEHKLTGQEVADRAGNSRRLLQRIEKSDLKCDIGAVFEVATILGVKLFDADESALSQRLNQTREKLALLPKSVRKKSTVVHDDHARNHAAFWNGKDLTLTPAYDLCPQGRTENEASQAMLISGNNNLSQLKTCLEVANHFLLSNDDARVIFAHIKETIEQHWDAVRDDAELSDVDRKLFWRRQFLNPFSIEL